MYEKIRIFILKLQRLPETKKKIIFFAVIIISGLIMLFFTIIATKNNVVKIGESVKSIKLPNIQIPQDEGHYIPSIDVNNIISNVSQGDQGVVNGNQETNK